MKNIKRISKVFRIRVKLRLFALLFFAHKYRRPNVIYGKSVSRTVLLGKTTYISLVRIFNFEVRIGLCKFD